MRRVAIVLVVVLSACGAEKAPHDVKASYVVACKADTRTLNSMEQDSLATTGGYVDKTTELHKLTTAGVGYTITVADARCGTIGHTVGQTPKDN
jgi:hypothetical protein